MTTRCHLVTLKTRLLVVVADHQRADLRTSPLNKKIFSKETADNNHHGVTIGTPSLDNMLSDVLLGPVVGTGISHGHVVVSYNLTLLFV